MLFEVCAHTETLEISSFGDLIEMDVVLTVKKAISEGV